jgi:hypothetical protein
VNIRERNSTRPSCSVLEISSTWTKVVHWALRTLQCEARRKGMQEVRTPAAVAFVWRIWRMYWTSKGCQTTVMEGAVIEFTLGDGAWWGWGCIVKGDWGR